MAPSPQLQRAIAAVKAMKLLGFCQEVAKKVLKELLKVYGSNWEYIEAENYRLLADAILDGQELKDLEANERDAAVTDEVKKPVKRLRHIEDPRPSQSTIEPEAYGETLLKKKKLVASGEGPSINDPKTNEIDAVVTNELKKPLKRLRHIIEDPGSSQSAIEPEACGETLLKKKKLVASGEGPLINLRGEMNKPVEVQCSYEGRGASLSPGSLLKNGIIGIGAPQHANKFEEPSPPSGCIVPKLTRHTTLSNQQRDEQYLCGRAGNVVCYKEPKLELDTEVMQEIVAVGTSTIPNKPMDVTSNDISTKCDVSIAPVASNGIPSVIIANQDEARKGVFSGANPSCGLTDPSNIQLAPNKGKNIESFQVSAQNELANVQERLSTNVNIASLNMGKSAADLAAESGVPQEDVVKLFSMQESLKSSQSPDIHRRMTRRSFNGSLNLVSLETPRTSMNGSNLDIDGESNGIPENCAVESSGNNASHCLAVLPLHENAVIASSPRHDEYDIAKGEERIKISVINEFTSEKTPSYFRYIPWNVVYQNAHVNFSLAQIGEDDCCINCFGNCLSAPMPCACTRETGGEFVYTLDGLLKKEFLNECISINCYTDKRHVYCKNCPIERLKGEDTSECKGHIVRKFIKECWSKCGCNKQCGNRVVQRGITRNLQVFYTPDGKGWGLRTLEELPRGAFVFEYVGEILTSRELYDRTVQRSGSAKHTYKLVLDANWGSEEGLRDEEALCLDATFYGNVGRFVNHRCFDANLVEVPVEWETPDHHYYHLAYFTTRKVEALEELTRDYWIDFKDRAYPINAFKCHCGSRFCRDNCRSTCKQ